MPSILEAIESAQNACRENGIEPNRVRMSPSTYRLLFNEMVESSDDLVFGAATIIEIEGLDIEVIDDCPPDHIYVDRKPEDSDDEPVAFVDPADYLAELERIVKIKRRKGESNG